MRDLVSVQLCCKIRHIEPLVFGDYPKTMRENVKERLPTLTEEDKSLVKGAFDFIGINYYTSRYAFKTEPAVPPHYLGDFLVKITSEIAKLIPSLSGVYQQCFII